MDDEDRKQLTGSDASPEYILQACDESLRRLQTDYIDLYQFHAGGYDPEAAVEVRSVLESLVASGKIRSYGWSTDDPERIEAIPAEYTCMSFDIYPPLQWSEVPAQRMTQASKSNRSAYSGTATSALTSFRSNPAKSSAVSDSPWVTNIFFGGFFTAAIHFFNSFWSACAEKP